MKKRKGKETAWNATQGKILIISKFVLNKEWYVIYYGMEDWEKEKCKYHHDYDLLNIVKTLTSTCSWGTKY